MLRKSSKYWWPYPPFYRETKNPFHFQLCTGDQTEATCTQHTLWLTSQNPATSNRLLVHSTLAGKADAPCISLIDHTKSWRTIAPVAHAWSPRGRLVWHLTFRRDREINTKISYLGILKKSEIIWQYSCVICLPVKKKISSKLDVYFQIQKGQIRMWIVAALCE